MDFFILGSQRCGTTWIHELLKSKGVCLPTNKQTYFFDRNYHLGLDWYYSQFAELTPEAKKGEVATGYCLPDFFSRLNEHFPSAKLILVVRHPIDRAFSNYSKRKDEYGECSFVQAISQDEDLLTRSLYGEMLEHIHSCGRGDDLLILFYEDLVKNPSEFAAAIFEHLDIEINESTDVSLPGVVNSSRYSDIARAMKAWRLSWLVRLLRRMKVKALVERAYKERPLETRASMNGISPLVREKLKLSDEKLWQYANNGYFTDGDVL